MGAGWRRWRLSWLIARLFWWLFVASLAWVPLTLAPCALTVMSVCNILFVDLPLFCFGGFWGMCDVNSCNVFVLLFMALWVPTSATLFRRAVLMRWHAFLFLGLRFFLFSSFRLVAFTAFSCKIFFYYNEISGIVSIDGIFAHL
jgi:hypothetical protein